MLRFHLDENVDVALAEALHPRGVDVTTAISAGLEGAADPEQLAFALREGRVLVTHDADFLRLAAQGTPHAGIGYCHYGARSVGEMLRALLLLCEVYDADAMIGRVEYL